MPKRVQVLKKIMQDTEPRLLMPMDMESLMAQQETTLDVNGDSLRFANLGYSPIKAPIDSAETMDFVSSAAGDTSDITVEVRGRVGDDELSESITINGTTTVPTTNSYTSITMLGVDGTRTGVITMSGTTSSTEYATIAPLEIFPEYQVIRIHPIRSSAENYSILYKKRVQALENDGDVIEIPISEALIEYATGDILENMRKWSSARQHFNNGDEIVDGYVSLYTQQGERPQQTRPFPWRGRFAKTVITNRD